MSDTVAQFKEGMRLPDELTARPQWVVTKIVPATEPGKKDAKIPISPKTEHGASSTSSSTWATFKDAAHLIEEWQGYDHTHVDRKTGAELSGLLVLPGYVFASDDPYVGIDLDHCIGESGDLAPWAQEIVDTLRSYTEISYSGKGLHIIIRGRKPEGAGCKRGHVECYDQGRYFALTGRTLNGHDKIKNRQAELESFLGKHLSQSSSKSHARPSADHHTSVDAHTVLDRAFASKKGEKLRLLLSGDNADWPSDSEADLSACNILAFFAGNVSDEVAQPVIDQIIRESGRYRVKWDEIHRPADGATYGRMTIEKALAGTLKRWDKQKFREQLTADAAELMRHFGLNKQDIVNAAYDMQKGCAELFTLLNHYRFCFDHAAGIWYVFKNHYWDLADVCQQIRSLDDVQALFNRAEVELTAEIDKLDEDIKACDNIDEIKKLENAQKDAKAQRNTINDRINQLNTLAYRKQVVEFAAVGEGSLGIGGTEWDLAPWLLACVNGVVNLRTGKLEPGRPEQYLKAYCPTPYDPAATAPVFIDAIGEIFANDMELVAFVQRVFGMALVGEVNERKVFIAEGRGRNGKDTLLGAISDPLGPRLAGAIQPEILLDQGRLRSSAGPSADIMRLQGLRLAIASETNEDCSFDASKLKLLTGGGELVGRAPYARREVAFKPSHTLVLMTNSRPHANADDYALWKRLTLIPFRMSFVEEPEHPCERKVRKDLPAKLKVEAVGILNWLVQGCLEWQRQGLNPPTMVKGATMEYQRDEDILLQFVDEACVIGDKLIVSAAALYSHYKSWSQDNGLRPMSGTKFGKKMAKRFKKEKIRSGIQYIGLGLPTTQ